jgi:hypothetical protein
MARLVGDPRLDEVPVPGRQLTFRAIHSFASGICFLVSSQAQSPKLGINDAASAHLVIVSVGWGTCTIGTWMPLPGRTFSV